MPTLGTSKARPIFAIHNRFRPSYIPNLEGVGDLLPSQVHSSLPLPVALEGWRRLACAVIEDALRCAGLSIEKPVLNTKTCGKNSGVQRRCEALAYLTGDQPSVALPIDVACAFAGIDEHALRQRVLRM